jgi:RHS repeat-associated protein
VTYGYDGAGRLTSETRTGTYPFTRAYTLDGVNRISQTLGGVTTSFSYSADDELTATSGGFVNSYSYNANGEQTGRALGGVAYSLSYDYDGQLTQITQGANTTSFSYDALGRRISRTSGGVTTQFLTDPVFGRIWLEKQGATTTATYTYGNALIRKDGEVPLFDGLGSERTVTNASQTVIGRIAYEGFGQSVGTTGSSSNPYLFAATSGYRNDGDAGLVHVGARYYDAQVGLFLTRDTYLEQKPYLYCEHDPVNATDPSGHDIELVRNGPWWWPNHYFIRWKGGSLGFWSRGIPIIPWIGRLDNPDYYADKQGNEVLDVIKNPKLEAALNAVVPVLQANPPMYHFPSYCCKQYAYQLWGELKEMDNKMKK